MKFLSLSDLIKENGEEVTQDILSSFSVSRNPDVECFIHDSAIAYEKSNNARSFIFINESGRPLGFVSLALSYLKLPENASNSLKKRLRGYGRLSSDIIPCYLIGQLARLDNVDKEDLPGNVIFSTIDYAVKEAQRFFGGRIISVDCVDDFVQYYINRGFVHLNKIDDLNQMVYLMKDFAGNSI